MNVAGGDLVDDRGQGGQHQGRNQRHLGKQAVERILDRRGVAHEQGALAQQVPGPDDFERGEDVVYPTRNGRFVIAFRGPPSVRFETATP